MPAMVPPTASLEATASLDATSLPETVTLTRRQTIVTYLVMMFAFAFSLAVRIPFGVYTTANFASAMLALGPIMATGMGVMEVTFRAALRRGGSLRAAGVISMVSVVPVVVGGNLLIVLVDQWIPWFNVLQPQEPRTATYQCATGVADSFPLIAAWMGIVRLPALLRLHEAREKELLLLRREAEILRLKAHLEPHFLLNTMNAIAGLVTEDPSQARELLGTLGDLLRDATSLAERHSVDEEVAWLERYVSIHQARFPGLFEVDWQLDPDVRKAYIPALLLQPLLENAITHGASKVEDGRIRVRGRRAADTLVFEIRDNGSGLGPKRSGGKGITIVERRLLLESSDRGEPASFSLDRDAGWTSARVTLPWGGATC